MLGDLCWKKQISTEPFFSGCACSVWDPSSPRGDFTVQDESCFTQVRFWDNLFWAPVNHDFV